MLVGSKNSAAMNKKNRHDEEDVLYGVPVLGTCAGEPSTTTQQQIQTKKQKQASHLM